MKNYQITEEEAIKLFRVAYIAKTGLPTSTSINALEATTALNSLTELCDTITQQRNDQLSPNDTVDEHSPLGKNVMRKKPIVKRTKKVS